MKYCLGNLSNHLSSLHERAELQGGGVQCSCSGDRKCNQKFIKGAGSQWFSSTTLYHKTNLLYVTTTLYHTQKVYSSQCIVTGSGFWNLGEIKLTHSTVKDRQGTNILCPKTDFGKILWSEAEHLCNMQCMSSKSANLQRCFSFALQSVC